MAPLSPSHSVRWYRSFFFRIGFGFVVFVVVVLLAQGAIFSLLGARSLDPFPNRSPNNLAAIVAADIGSALTQNAGLDLNEYMSREYGRVRFPIYVVMKDGRVASNSSERLPEGVKRAVISVLGGVDFRRGDGLKMAPPIVKTPIQAFGALQGMVVLAPPRPPGPPFVRLVGHLLSVPGTVLLIVTSTIAAAFIFEPARRRLKALERATERLGAGDLSARAPETGGDEVARVASAFNRMANELAARDEALRTSDRLRRQMLADVSHELKTPLTSIRGYVETLRMSERAGDAAARARHLDTVERETERLQRIVQDLVDLARYENGAGSLDVRTFAADRLLGHVVRRHDPEAQRMAVELRTFVDRDADQIEGDPDRLEQVIENLVSYALRHTPSGGVIEIRASTEPSAVSLSVVDSGTGIGKEHLPHVFDRFYKVDASRTNGSGGSGLGLSIAKAIVERHGGTIRVTSVPGRTEFRVVLPQPVTPVTGAPPP